MNASYNLSMIALAVSLVLTGCASSGAPSISAVMPPPTSEALPDSTVANEEIKVELQDGVPLTDNGSGQIIPLKDLPTKTIRGAAYPYAIKTQWPGYVKSPYAQDKKLVDVSAFPSDTPVQCPHTRKIFIVP